MKKTASALCLAASLFLLASCDHISSNDAAVIPDVQEYSAAQQDAAAKELETYGPYMPVVAGQMIPDYGVMRKQARAAKKILPN